VHLCVLERCDCWFESRRVHECVLSGRVLRVGTITRPRGPTECGVPECDREASTMKRFRVTTDCCVHKERERRSLLGNDVEHIVASFILLTYCLLIGYRRPCSQGYRHLLCLNKSGNAWTPQVFQYNCLITLYNNQRNAQTFNLFIYLLLPYMFRASF
jgi:hypothetical protein